MNGKSERPMNAQDSEDATPTMAVEAVLKPRLSQAETSQRGGKKKPVVSSPRGVPRPKR